MSSSSSSFPVFAQSALLKSDQLVQKIEVYDVKSSNPILTVANARHCFMIITINGKTRLVEAGDDNGIFRISYSETTLYAAYKGKQRKLVQFKPNNLKIKRLANIFDVNFKGKKYNVFDLNCYHVAMYLFEILGQTILRKKISDKYFIQIQKGLRSSTGVIGAIGGFAIGGPVGALVGFIGGKCYGWVGGKILFKQK